MIRVPLTILALLAAPAALARAADTPTPPPVTPFPVLPQVQPTDPPKPDPDAVTVLPDDYLLIVKSDAEFVLRASPKGKVDIVRAVSPQIGGKFVGGNGKFKLETFKEKNVAIVMKRAGADGLVELIYSPAGAKDDSTDIARMVQLGTAPQPPPKPVDPVDPKTEAPIPEPGFRVLITFETGTVLTASQQSILYGKTVREYLDSHCVVDPDGKTRGYRIWDKDTVADGDFPVWKTAFNRPRKSIPWVLISNGKTGFEGPLPANPTDMLALLKKYNTEGN